MSLIYNPLDQLTNIEIKNILEKEDIDELIKLPLSVGENHVNWKYAQEICVKLSNYEDSRIRANAVLGFAYIARTKGMLEKHIVKPIILRELKENKECQWRILDAIDDINFMKWYLGKNALHKGED